MESLIEGNEVKKEPIDKATNIVLDECRMVLPGIQALFGFQLVAAFEPEFRKLTSGEQTAHVVALALTAVAIVLVMGPAAYHRQVHPESVSKEHLRVSSWMLTIGMVPLMLAITTDLYLVARLITGSAAAAGGMTGVVFLFFVGIWIVLPRMKRYQRKGTIL